MLGGRGGGDGGDGNSELASLFGATAAARVTQAGTATSSAAQGVVPLPKIKQRQRKIVHRKGKAPEFIQREKQKVARQQALARTGPTKTAAAGAVAVAKKLSRWSSPVTASPSAAQSATEIATAAASTATGGGLAGVKGEESATGRHLVPNESGSDSDEDAVLDRRRARARAARLRAANSSSDNSDSSSDDGSGQEEEEEGEKETGGKEKKSVAVASASRPIEDKSDDGGDHSSDSGSGSDSGESSSGESDSDSESSNDDVPLMPGAARAQPRFIPKSKRETIRKEEERRKAEEAKWEAAEAAKAERKEETVAMIAKEVEEEKKRQKRAATASSWNADERRPGRPEDRDGIDEEKEFADWVEREKSRLIRDEMKRREELFEMAETLRRSKLTDEERKLEDEALIRQGLKKDPNQEKTKRKFLQRYYHKGAFFMDDDSLALSEKKQGGKQDVRRQEFAEATMEDRFDAEAMPKVMQVRNFGRKGQTKWTHLANEDTSRKDSLWGAGNKRHGEGHDGRSKRPRG